MLQLIYYLSVCYCWVAIHLLDYFKRGCCWYSMYCINIAGSGRESSRSTEGDAHSGCGTQLSSVPAVQRSEHLSVRKARSVPSLWSQVFVLQIHHYFSFCLRSCCSRRAGGSSLSTCLVSAQTESSWTSTRQAQVWESLRAQLIARPLWVREERGEKSEFPLHLLVQMVFS